MGHLPTAVSAASMLRYLEEVDMELESGGVSHTPEAHAFVVAREDVYGPNILGREIGVHNRTLSLIPHG